MSELRLGAYRLLDEGIVKARASEPKREYLGASVLGIECDRQLWYEYHAPIPIEDPRILRIFDLGKSIEELVLVWLVQSGISVWTKDSNGEQFGFIDSLIAGHWDGIVVGLPESAAPHVLEVKSAKASSFKEFESKGLTAANHRYYIQCQVYMLKAGVEDCLFICVNKDTCELYIERVKLDKAVAENAIMRGKEIVATKEMPDRKYSKSSHFRCKMCSYRNRCWGIE